MPTGEINQPKLWATKQLAIPKGDTSTMVLSVAANIYLAYNTVTGRLQIWNGTSWSDVKPLFIPVASTTDVVDKAFLNTTYPLATNPIGTVVAYFNLNKRYERVGGTTWTEITTILTP